MLDACASPGGKTTAMAARWRTRGLIVATDVRGRRVDLLARTVPRSGAHNVRVVQADAARALPFRPVFDARAPRRPLLGSWHDPARSRPQMAAARRTISPDWRRRSCGMLEQAADGASARRHGSIYATCSSEPEENDEVVDAFLDRRADFRDGPSPAWSASGLGPARRTGQVPHPAAPRRARSVFRRDLGEIRASAVNFKIHGTYDARVERGQAAPARRRCCCSPTSCLPRRRCGWRIRAREVIVPGADRPDGQPGDDGPVGGRTEPQGRGDAAAGSEGRGRPDPDAGPAGRRPHPARSAASRCGSVGRAAVQHRAGAHRRVRADRAAAAPAGRARAGRRLRDPLRRLPGRRVVAQTPPPDRQGRPGLAARQSRRSAARPM